LPEWAGAEFGDLALGLVQSCFPVGHVLAAEIELGVVAVAIPRRHIVAAAGKLPFFTPPHRTMLSAQATVHPAPPGGVAL
jgi:hypothetical protein